MTLALEQNMKRWILVALLASGAVIINGLIISDAVHSLTLTGAAQAQADYSFYFLIMLYGPAAAILAITGLQVSHMQGLKLNHPFVIIMLVNALLPFATYGMFKLLWS